MNTFDANLSELYNGLGEAIKMVFSTSSYDHVTSRMVSIIIKNRVFYFQTDKMSRKYVQLSDNSKAALCADNYQIEGVCEDIGRPVDNAEFCRLYKKHYAGSYAAYSMLESERLIAFKPSYIKLWTYEDGKPFEAVFDFACGKYEKKRYLSD